MDCRRSLVLALSLAAGVQGCARQSALPLAGTLPTPPVPPQVTVQKEPDPPPRPPKPATCVALGILNDQEADDPKLAPAQREQLRTRARKAYQRALEIEPTHLPALAALARLYVKVDDHDRAVSAYHRALETHPKEAVLWYELGMYHGRHKEWEAALPGLEKATQLEPENQTYANAYGFGLARAGRYDESLVFFQKTCGDAQAHYNVARMLQHIGQTERSKQHLQLALQAQPDLAAARQLLTELERPAPNAPQAVVPAGHQATP